MYYPKITVITPSYNQSDYLEETILSIVEQDYPNLEYIVIDGGSSDGSADILKKYSSKISRWVSEADNGQVDAINKGIYMATGEWIAWQNSDDVYFPGVFHSLAREAERSSDVSLITGNILHIDGDGKSIRDLKYVKPSYNAMLAEGMVLSSQAAFWKKSIHSEIGYINPNYNCAFDMEWFLRILKHYKAAHVNEIWGGFRQHELSKTAKLQSEFQSEKERILQGYSASFFFKKLYQLRRASLMLAQGDLSYLMRGLFRRFMSFDSH